MKAHLLIIALAWQTTNFSQGFLIFSNFPDAPVRHPDGQGPGPRATAGLFLVGAGGSLSLVATAPFRSSPEASPFLHNGLVQVPGIPPGSAATFRVRVWETSAGSYEAAVASGLCHGEFPTISGNNQITLTLANEFLDGPPHPNTVDALLPFTLTCIPEPSSLSIIVAGLALAALATRLLPGPAPASHKSSCGRAAGSRELTSF